MADLVREREKVRKAREFEEKEAESKNTKLPMKELRKDPYYISTLRQGELEASVIVCHATIKIADDLMNNNGIEFKTFVHQLIESRNQIVPKQLTKEEKELSLIKEGVMRLNESKNRMEKRKIMEQYDLNPYKPWGLLKKADIKKPKVDLTVQHNLVYNFKARGYVNRDEYNKIIGKLFFVMS